MAVLKKTILKGFLFNRDIDDQFTDQLYEQGQNIPY